MTQTQSLDHDVEEWSCASCGRRLLLRRPPAFEKIVLERGDEWAAHVGGSVDGPRVAAVNTLRELSAQAREWLAAHGIDWETGGTPQ
jgi:hypothetical protein